MADKILLRRGNRTDLPALQSGEPGVALDTRQVFIGSTAGNFGLATALDARFKIQSGSQSANLTASGQTDVNITFAAPFSVAPILLSGLSDVGPGGSQMTCDVGVVSTSASGAVLRIKNNSASTASVVVSWIAVGA